jgi:integrase
MPYRKKLPTEPEATPGQSPPKPRTPNPYWYVRVPTRNDGAVQKSTCSILKNTALRIERMLSQFKTGNKRDHFELIDAVHEGRLTLLDLLEADDRNGLPALRDQLAPPVPAAPPAPSVCPEIARWGRWLSDHVVEDTMKHYRSAAFTYLNALAIRTEAAALIAEAGRNGVLNPKADQEALRNRKRSREELLALHCPASAFTTAALYGWLNDLEVSASTKRKYHAAMRSFIAHLVRADMFTGDNPMDKVPVPPAGDPRTNYLETYEAVRLVNAFADEEYRCFNALMAGSGIEVSAALSVRRRDVDEQLREVRAPGTKTYNRDRIVRVAEWAWPFVEKRIQGLGPDDELFDGIPDRWTARDVFIATVFPLVLDYPCYQGYVMRDHRHTYAVRAARAGTPPQLIADQLGHVNAVLVLKVYGKFLAKSEDRDRWEKKAAAMDEQAGILPHAVGTPSGTIFTPGQPTAPKTKKVEWPEVSSLLEMLAAMSTKAVAEKIGVSDVAVRKHLKARGIEQLPDGRRSGTTRPRTASSDGGHRLADDARLRTGTD